MPSLECPRCRAALELHPQLAAVVCAKCQTQVDALGGGLGRVEGLAPGTSRLAVGIPLVIPARLLPSHADQGQGGEHVGAVIVGGVQWRHSLGGVWTEWALALKRAVALPGTQGELAEVAWLSDHQGRLALLFERSPAAMRRFGSSNAATPGQRYQTSWGRLECVDRGVAAAVGRVGQIPLALAGEVEREFIDFSGPPDRVASLSFEGERDANGRQAARFFYGHEVTAEQVRLGLAEISKVEASCPRCGETLTRELVAGTQIVCRRCRTGSRWVGDGLERSFEQSRTVEAIELPIGARATLAGSFLANARSSLGSDLPPWPSRLEVVVRGFVVRSVVVDGETFHYSEYLLEVGSGGFVWLVLTDGKWYLARTVNSSLVSETARAVEFGGERFMLHEANRAVVVQVEGEHDYLIKPGDEAQVADYLLGSRLVSKEETVDEIVWTECLLVPADAVARAFGVALRRRQDTSAGADSDDEGGGGSDSLSPLGVAVIVIVLVIFLVYLSINGDCGGGGGSFGFGK